MTKQNETKSRRAHWGFVGMHAKPADKPQVEYTTEPQQRTVRFRNARVLTNDRA